MLLKQVRVRFAPSPTGHIHLGGLRAALYNYIFAKKNNGQFVLRIEDTDQSRIVPGSADEIERVLNWANLTPDESPQLGGPFGPYEQSKRLGLYKEYSKQLLNSGQAYRCFCSSTRLELLRKYQAKNREKWRYDGKCKHLTRPEIEAKLNECNHENFVVRFSLFPGQDSFEDLVFGQITANLVEAQESDPIIMKSDGYPTYHFANIVDDHLMQISHVLRGSEWISSTIKHIQLYRALQWKPPSYIHLPLVTMRDGSKMSKRNDHSHVTSWINAGYQPDTLFNFLTNSGGGVPKSKQDAMDFWTLQELIDGFDFSQLTSHPGSLDLNRLRIYSTKELQRAWAQDKREVMRRFRELLERQNFVADIDDSLAESIIGQLISRLTSLNDLLSHDYVYIWSRPKLTWCKQEYRATDKGWPDLGLIIQDIIKTLDKVGIEDKDKFTSGMKELAQGHKLDYAEIMKFLRKVLTNSEKSLPVYEICNCLGPARLREYLYGGLDYVTDK